ncbi:hypothetical protein Btru_023833 [Bulinus truncatus]|nr:hypothetical protein Btru_023833 [Bulinus truncatus]
MAAFSREASTAKRARLLLTVGIPSDKSFLDKYYDTLAISNYVDMVDLATYAFDLGNPKEVTRPKHHSPLYSNNTTSTKTIDFMARYVAGMGVRKEKMNIGLPFMISTYYGKTETRMYHFALIGVYASVKYVKANGYGGVLLYRIGDDDGLNDCDKGYNPLSKAVLEECSSN